MRLTFEQAAERIKQLDQAEGATAFEVGDLTLDQSPVGSDSLEDAACTSGSPQTNAGTSDPREVLTALAQASGVPVDVLRERRLVASRVPPDRRLAGVAWSVYQELARIEDQAARNRLLDMLESEPTWARELDALVEFLATCSDVQDVRRWSARRALAGLRDAVGRCLIALPAPEIGADVSDRQAKAKAAIRRGKALASAS